MTYTIEKDEILQSIRELISRAASEAVGKEGESLYDLLKVTSRDSGVLDMHFEDALSGICVEMNDIASVVESSIEFNVPDFDTTLEGVTKSALDRYVCYAVCAAWFEEKGLESATLYAGRATAALSKALVLLKSRKAPKRENK